MTTPSDSSASLPISPPSTRAELQRLLHLAGPVVLSQFAANALGLIATAIVGRLGERELAAAGYANASYYLVYMFVLGVMLSVAPRVAQAYGAGDSGGVARSFRAGLYLAAALSAVTLPLIWLLTLILPALGPKDIDTNLVADYLRLYSLGMLPNLIFVALRGTLEGTGKPQAVTAVSLIGVACAAAVGPALAFGWGPLPHWGLLGAAAGSVSAAWLMAGLLWQQARSRVQRLSREGLGRDGAGSKDTALTPGSLRAELGALVRLGWPIGLTLGAEGGMFSVTTLLMARFGSEVLAAHNLTMQAITALFMIPLGVASTTGVRVGQEAGASRPLHARRAGLVGLAVSAGVMLSFAALELLAPQLIFGLFVNVNDPANRQMLAVATGFLSIAALFQLMDGLQVTANGALRGLHDTRYPLLVSLVSYWVIGLGLGLLLSHTQLGARGFWFGLIAGLSCAALALVRRFWRLSGGEEMAREAKKN